MPIKRWTGPNLNAVQRAPTNGSRIFRSAAIASNAARNGKLVSTVAGIGRYARFLGPVGIGLGALATLYSWWAGRQRQLQRQAVASMQPAPNPGGSHTTTLVPTNKGVKRKVSYPYPWSETQTQQQQLQKLLPADVRAPKTSAFSGMVSPSELKYFDFIDETRSMHSDGVILQVNNIPEGATAITRTGCVVYLRQISVSGVIRHIPSSTSAEECEILLVYDLQPYSQFLPDPTVISNILVSRRPGSPVNLLYSKRFVILDRRRCVLGALGRPPQIQSVDFQHNCNLRTTFFNSDYEPGFSQRVATGALYVVWLGTAPVLECPVFTGSVRVRFSET